MQRSEQRVQVLDCTIRDGGLMNKWNFDDGFVRSLVYASSFAGVDYIELGYKASAAAFDPKLYGAWRFCREEVLRDFWPDDAASKLSVMLDIGRFDPRDLLPAAKSVVALIRIACYVHQVDEAIETSLIAHDLGYETFINIMAVSEAQPAELHAGLRRIAEESPTRGVYIVDSYGNLTPRASVDLAKSYAEHCPGKELGFHGHNNAQLALANSLALIEAGVSIVDASLAGMGRGAGNTPLELLLPQLGAPLSRLVPLFELIEERIPRLQADLRWGYHLPYILSGLANQHPKEAMELMDSGKSVISSGYLDRLARVSTPA